jgi:hypothetical protein
MMGTDYKLRPTCRNLIAVEDEIGKPISKLVGDVSIKDTCTFIKNTIYHEDGKKVTSKEWDDILDNCHFSDLYGALSKINETFSDEEPGDGEKN